jgi:hypothetical protein
MLSFGAVAASVAFASSRAEAQEKAGSFAAQGAFLISADRLYGIYYGKEQTKVDAGGGQTVTSSDSHTGFGLGLISPTNVLQTPRLALDYAVIPNLTIGAGLGYTRFGTSTKVEAAGTTTEHDGATTSGYVLAPRVGYSIPVGGLAIWLRGGLSLGKLQSESKDEKTNVTTTYSNSVFDLSLEPTLAFMLTPSFGLLVGVAIDVPLGGTAKVETSGDATANTHENEYRVTNFGLTFGMVGQL